MRQNLDKVRAAYNSVAKEYAETFYGEHEKKPKDQEILHRFAAEIGQRSPVWDFGCGPGQTTKFLHDLGVRLSGMDLSENVLRQARLINPELCFREGNMLELDFENGTIAGIVAFYAIVHFTEEQVAKAFREIFRVLQTGGLLLLAYHIGNERIHLDEFLGKQTDLDFMFFSTRFIDGCLKECGFDKIETIERDPYVGVESETRRAYVFARKPVAAKTV